MSQRRARRQRQIARAKQATPATPAPAAAQSSVPQRYEALHYTGDVTGSDAAQPRSILGCDELGRPYEVIDAEYNEADNRTTVQLQYASPDSIQTALAAAGVLL